MIYLKLIFCMVWGKGVNLSFAAWYISWKGYLFFFPIKLPYQWLIFMQILLLYLFAFWLPNTNSLPVSVSFAQSLGYPDCCFSYICIYIYIYIHIYESWSHSTFISLFEAVLIFIILLAIAIIPSGIISTSMGLRYFCLHAFTTHHIADWTNLTIVANMFKYCKLQNFAVVYSITD